MDSSTTSLVIFSFVMTVLNGYVIDDDDDDDKKAVIDCRLCPLCTNDDEYLLVFIIEQNLVGISAVVRVLFYRCLGLHPNKNAHDVP